MMRLNRKVLIWSAALMLLAASITGGAILAKPSLTAAGVEAPIFAPPTKNLAVAAPLAASYAPLIKQALPEVVSVTSSRRVSASEDGPNPMFDDPFFRQFFGGRQPRAQEPQKHKEQGLGSGVIVGTNGYILTNNHVVDGATDVKVSFNDKREMTAKVIGRDPKTDIAVLKVDAEHLPAMSLGDSSKVQVGDLAFAIGNPFGVGQTVTMGIVSATGRANLGIEDYEDFIQTDAAINPGNSGGALINAQGELIGINTAILTGGGGGNQGVGFAVPVNLAKRIMDQIVEHGRVVRGYLGATIQNVTPAMASALGMDSAEGVLIGDVTPNGPAALAGVKAGDVIMKLNGQSVADSAALRLQVSQTAPGSTVSLTLRRGTSTMDVSVKLGELPEEHEKASNEGSDKQSLRGLEVEALTPAIRQQLHLGGNTTGVVISQVDPNGPGATAGLRQGDVVEQVNHQPVGTVSEFEQAMRGAGDKTILLRVERDGSGFFVALEPR